MKIKASNWAQNSFKKIIHCRKILGQHYWLLFLKWAILGILFLYFRLFNADFLQLIANKILPISGFEHVDLGFGKRPLSHIGLLESNSNKINCFITVSLFFSNSSPTRRTICLSYFTETNVSLRFKFVKKSETLKGHLIFSTKIT